MGVGHENEEEELLGILLGAHEWGGCGGGGGVDEGDLLGACPRGQ